MSNLGAPLEEFIGIHGNNNQILLRGGAGKLGTKVARDFLSGILQVEGLKDTKIRIEGREMVGSLGLKDFEGAEQLLSEDGDWAGKAKEIQNIIRRKLQTPLMPVQAILGVDVSSDPSLASAQTFSQRCWQLVTANKTFVVNAYSTYAYNKIRSRRFNAEPTVMAGRGALSFMQTHSSPRTIELISSGSMSKFLDLWTQRADNGAWKYQNVADVCSELEGDLEAKPFLDFGGADLAGKMRTLLVSINLPVEFEDLVPQIEPLIGWGLNRRERGILSRKYKNLGFDKFVNAIRSDESVNQRLREFRDGLNLGEKAVYLSKVDIVGRQRRVEFTQGLRATENPEMQNLGRKNLLIITPKNRESDPVVFKGAESGPIPTTAGIMPAMNLLLNRNPSLWRGGSSNSSE